MNPEVGPLIGNRFSSIAQIENDCQFRTSTLFDRESGNRIRPMRKVNTIIYGAFGVLAMAYGLGALISPSAIAPEANQSFPVAHILREQGAAGVFIGLMVFWCVFNYERRMAVHYFLMIFAFLVAGIHWFDFFKGHLPWMSPVYNSVPFLILLLMALLNRIASRF